MKSRTRVYTRPKGYLADLRKRYAIERLERERFLELRRRIKAQKKYAFELETAISVHILRRKLENAFIQGWTKTTNGRIYCQSILDGALANCESEELAFEIGIQCANEINRLSGRENLNETNCSQ